MSGEVNSNKPVTPQTSGQVSNVKSTAFQKATDATKPETLPIQQNVPPNIAKAFENFPLKKTTDQASRGSKTESLLAKGFNILSGDGGNEIAQG